MPLHPVPSACPWQWWSWRVPPPLTSDKDGFVPRTTYMCQIFILLEPLTCARSIFCWNYQLCFFLQPFACANTLSFLKPLIVQIPNFVRIAPSLLFQKEDTRLIWRTTTKCDARGGDFILNWIDRKSYNKDFYFIPFFVVKHQVNFVPILRVAKRMTWVSTT